MGEIKSNVISFGDIHFGKKGNSRQYNEQALKTVEGIVDTAKDNDIKYGIFNGDWFDDRINIKSDTLHYSSLALTTLNEYFKSVNGVMYFILGNHDLYYRNSRDITGLTFLKQYSHIQLISEPTDVDIGNKKVSLFPWLVETDDLAKIITDAKGEYLFCHGEFRNFKWNVNSTMYTKGLPVEAFSKFRHVYSGHYHLRQSQGNITYLGSPQQQDFGDVDCERGWSVIDLETNDLTFIQNDVSSEYHIIELSLLSKSFDLIRDNHIKIIENVELHTDEFNKIYDHLIGMNPSTLIFERMKREEDVAEVDDGDIESLESLLLDLVVDGNERGEECKSILMEKL